MAESSENVQPVQQSSMRGYKLTEDGKKTSYFHMDISEEAKRLIGDCRPQKIEPVSESAPSTSAPSLKSAWNESTWEAKGYNKWVEKKVHEVFPLTQALGTPPAEEFECVCSYDSFDGDLEIVTMRGGPRIINNVSYTFAWKLYKKSARGAAAAQDEKKEIADGKLIYHNDGNAEYDTEFTHGVIKSEASTAVNTYIKKEGSVLQAALMAKIEGMMADFRAESGLKK